MNIIPNFQIFKPPIMVQQRQNNQRTYLASNNQDMFVHSVPSFKGNSRKIVPDIFKMYPLVAAFLPAGFAALKNMMNGGTFEDNKFVEKISRQEDAIAYLINENKCNVSKESLKSLSEEQLSYLLDIISDFAAADNYKTTYYDIPELIKAVRIIKVEHQDDFRNLILELDEIKDDENFPNYCDNIAEFINEYPDKISELESYLVQPGTKHTRRSIENLIQALTDESLSQEVRNFLLMEFGDIKALVCHYYNVQSFVINHPEFIDEFKEYIKDDKIYYLDSALENIKSPDSLSFFLRTTKEDDNGDCRFNNHIAYIKDFDKNLEKIKYLAELKYPDGEYFFNASQIQDMIEEYHSDIELYRNSTPPLSSLNAYVLYERSFRLMQDEAAKFGCKTFKELEEKIKTFNRQQKAEAGKLLHKIKKNAIDTFFEGLPLRAAIMLAGDKGSYTAADLDRAMEKFNSNSILRKYLEDIENTGKIKLGNSIKVRNSSIDKKYVYFNPLENVLLSDYKNMNSIVSTIFSSKPELRESNPAEFRQLYEKLNKLYELLKDKYIESIKASGELKSIYNGNIKKAIDENFDDKYMMHLLFVCEDLIGLGNISGLIHNESVSKSYKYLKNINDIGSFKEIHDMFKRVVKEKQLKDNDLKNIINITAALENNAKIKDIYEIILNSEKIDNNEIKKIILREIYNFCGIKTNITDKMLKEWDSEYLPFVIKALNDLSDKNPLKDLFNENRRLLIGLLKADFEGKYKQYLFDPNTPNGARNIQSKQIYEENGLNFNEAMNFDGKVEFRFRPKAIAIEPVNISIVEDFRNMLADTKIGPIFREFMQKEKIKIISDKKFTVQGKELSRQEMIGFITLMNKFISNNSKIIESSNIADVKDHFVNRKRALNKTLSNISKDDNLTISLWKRDIKHDLFLGHYCQCCISLDGINNKAIIQSLSHTVDQIAELKTSNGTTVGKVKMLFLKDTNSGEVILLANGFEIIDPYNFDNTIRDKFVEFMRNYSKAVAGKEIPIYTGESYQKINIDDLSIVKGNFQLLGRTPKDTYHLDSYAKTESSWPEELDRPHDLELKVMYRPE